MQRVAVLSLHTSPLAQPGSGDSGGMNVYVRELVSALAQAGVECTTYTRAHRARTSPRWCRSSPVTAWCTCPPAPFDLRKEAAAVGHRRVRRPVSIDHLDERVPGRRAARQLLAQRSRRPPAEARARHAVRQHVPHAGQGEGRGRRLRARVARAGRGRDHRLRRRHLRQLHRGGAPVPPPLRRPARVASRSSRPASSTRSSPPATAAAPGSALDLPARRAGAAVRRSHPAAEGARRRRAGAGRDAPARRAAADRRWRQRPRGRRRGGPPARAHRSSWACATRCASCRRSRTTSSAPTTAPPMSCWCPAAARASASSRSRRRRAASRWWPAAVGGLLTLVDHGEIGLPGARPRPARCSPSYVNEILDDPACAPPRMGARGAERARRYTWSLAAARLRRLYADLTVPRAGRLRMTDVYRRPRARRSFEQQIDQWLAGFQAENPAIEAIDRGDGDERALVRAPARRGEGAHHHLAHARPAHAALRGLRACRRRSRTSTRCTRARCAATSGWSVRTSRSVSRTRCSCAASCRSWRSCEAELDRVIGSLYAYVEQSFPALIRLGYASHFAEPTPIADALTRTDPDSVSDRRFALCLIDAVTGGRRDRGRRRRPPVDRPDDRAVGASAAAVPGT